MIMTKPTTANIEIEGYNYSMELPDDYIEIKAEVFKIIRANSDCRSAKKVMEAIKKHLPDVSPEVIRQALSDLFT